MMMKPQEPVQNDQIVPVTRNSNAYLVIVTENLYCSNLLSDRRPSTTIPLVINNSYLQYELMLITTGMISIFKGF